MSSLYQIEKLCESNYDTWSIQMQSVLIHSELWDVTIGAITEPEVTHQTYAAWSSANKKSLATIILSVKPTQLNFIKNCTKAADAWTKLKNIYKDSGPIKKVSLCKKLLNARLAEGVPMSQHINNFAETADKLAEADMKVSEEFLVVLLLSSLPSSYEQFVIAMETRDKLPSLESLKIKLLEENDRQQENEQKGESSGQQAFIAYNNNRHVKNDANNASNNKKPNGTEKFKCYNCGRNGHFARNCRAPRRNKEVRQQQHSFAMLAANAQTLNNTSWCVDSGATAHMCCDRNMFKTFKSYKEKILLACDKFIESAGIGDVQITGVQNILLKDVLYVPNIIGNFISVSRAVKNNYKVIFEEKFAKIIHKNYVVLHAEKINNLYVYYPQYNTLAHSSVSNIIQWHNRFGHLNFKTLNELANKKIVTGISIKGVTENMSCKTCMRSKICSKPFTKSESRSENILDLIHSDVCGPMSKPSIGGARYFILFIDDKSRKIFVYFLKAKSEVFDKFKIFKKLVECQTGRKIKTLRTDNGTEYVNGNFNKFLEESGIRRQLTVCHTPQQNGVSERANRTIVEMARSMMIHSGATESLWAEAVNTAVYIRNRTTTKILGEKTPNEVWTGKVPCVKHFRVFGSVAIALNKQQNRKFAPKGNEYIFVGYSTTAKAYRLYCKKTHKIVEKRDVIFEESELENSKENDCVTVFDEKQAIKKVAERNQDDEGEDAKFNSSNEKNESKQSGEESSDEDESENERNNNEINKIGPGRPKILRTGLPGRPRKQYNIINLMENYNSLNPQSVSEAMNSTESENWHNAMKEEYHALLNNQTWTLEDLPEGQETVGSRWVFTIKRDENGNIERYKARLVAKGCSQKLGINYTETFSPVVRHATIRLVIALAAEYQLYLHQMDVSSAYLNSELEDDIYMTQPEMFIDEKYPTRVLKLKKALYGLKQSGRAWNVKLDAALVKMGFKACASEPCLYVNRDDGFHLITVYVDDLIIGSSDHTKLKIIKGLISEQFKVVDGGPLHHFLGMEITREGDTGSIAISQKQYILKLLKQHNMEECRTTSTPLEAGFQTYCNNDNCKTVDPLKYQALIGAMTHLAVLTRPDIIHSVSKLAQRNSNPHNEHLEAAKHLLRYLHKTANMKLKFQKTDEPVKGYVDADWGGDAEDRKSYTGYGFVFANAVFAWESRKQSIVALSSTEAEYVALSLAAKEAVYLRKLFRELGLEVNNPIEINGDNLSSQQLVKNPVYHARSKHIHIRFHYIRNVYKNKEISLNYICTNELFADIFTKNLSKIKHERFVKAMGLE